MDSLQESLIQIFNEHKLIVDGYLNLNQFSALLFDSLEVDGSPIQTWIMVHDHFIDIICANNEDYLGQNLILQIEIQK
jgi:hypothetical protein